MTSIVTGMGGVEMTNVTKRFVTPTGAAMTAIQKPSTVAGLPDPEAIPTKPAKNTTPVTRE